MDIPQRLEGATMCGRDPYRLRKGFIRAEVIKYEDYIQYGSEAAVREAGNSA